MGLFDRTPTPEPDYIVTSQNDQPSLDDTSEDMKNTAIEYMVSLDKRELESFIEGVTLIWQGYNNNVEKIKTRHQKALQRSLAKANGTDAPAEDDDDELAFNFLDDEPVKSVPTVPAKRPLGAITAPTKVEVK